MTRLPETSLQLWLADTLNAVATVILIALLGLGLWALTGDGWTTIHSWLVW